MHKIFVFYRKKSKKKKKGPRLILQVIYYHSINSEYSNAILQLIVKLYCSVLILALLD